MNNTKYAQTKKMCIFVEGQTEQIFVKKLIEEIASVKKVTVILSTARGGEKSERIHRNISQDTEEKEFFVQIIDSGNENSVVSDILENIEGLKNANFKKILGLRDLFPKKLTDLSKMKEYNQKLTKNLELDSKIIITIREIETWFLKEYTHFEKIDTRLTLEYIKILGYDLEMDNLEEDEKYSAPTKVMKQIYESLRKSYSKKKNRVEYLVDKLDYEKIYLELSERLTSLNEFLEELNGFFS
ncbi:MAG: DUF4276 family protein [Fusobacteriaceae bacterium]